MLHGGQFDGSTGAAAMTGAGHPNASGIKLRIEEPGLPARLVASEASPLVIGRDAQCDVVLQDPLASRRHAQIEQLADGRVALRDLGSSNGTYLDDRRVETSAWLTLPCRIRVGHTVVSVEERVAPPAVTAIGVPAIAGAALPGPRQAAPESPAPAEASAVELPPASPLAAPVPPGPPSAVWTGSAVQTEARREGRRPIIWIVGLAGVLGVAIIAVVFGGGLLGKPAPSVSIPSSVPSATTGPTIAPGPTAIASLAPSPTAASLAPGVTPAPATTFEFVTSQAGATSTTTMTTNKTACSRDQGNPHSLRVTFTTSGPDASTVTLVDDDTAKDPPMLSSLDITLNFAKPLHDVVITAGDLTKLDVRDSGDHASVSLSAKNTGGDVLTGTITCSSIGP